MTLRSLTTICLLSLSGVFLAPMGSGAQEKSAAEKSWKAGDPAAHAEKGQRRKVRQGAPVAGDQSDPMMEAGPDGPPPPPPPPPSGGAPDRPVRDLPGTGPRLERRLMQLRMEAQRLQNVDRDVEQMKERTSAMKEQGTLSGEREKRLEKIASLKREINGLEREEFVARTKVECENALKNVQERLDGVQEKEAPESVAQWTRTRDSLEKISKSTGSFETLVKALEEMAPELPTYGNEGGRDVRMRREVEVLRKRIENLQREYGEFEGSERMDEPPMRHPRPRVGINGNDDGMYQGLDAQPPAARRRDSQAGEEKSRDSEQGNANK
ncbi:hypothetical protein IT570_03855 [Candidatus Sumerlaeota bacterium]|nr:hypothetical protein [Candidatus Sumerlaeota bacterium]